METLRILHTNDLHSHFEHFPKIGRYLKKAQADKSASEVYTFDAGDFMDRSHPLSDATEGQANIELIIMPLPLEIMKEFLIHIGFWKNFLIMRIFL